jgi:hypothetical protein
MKILPLLIALVLALQLTGCTWDFVGPCHRATLLRKDAENAQGLKKAELLGKADGLQAECDRQNQKIYNAQKHGR